MKKRWSIIFYVVAAFGWWGLFFPEFTYTPDTYEIIEDEQMLEQLENDKEIKIIVDSKLRSILAKYF